MAIPESQLETWSHQGAEVGSRDTYATVKRALEASDTKYAGKRFEVFLQGSYGNDTNIWAESDVDVVIRLDSVYYYDIDALTPDEQARFNAALIPGTYPYANYKAVRFRLACVNPATFNSTQPVMPVIYGFSG